MRKIQIIKKNHLTTIIKFKDFLYKMYFVFNVVVENYNIFSRIGIDSCLRFHRYNKDQKSYDLRYW